MGLLAGLPAGPFAGNPLPLAPSELEERAQPKTGEKAGVHLPPPLGLAVELDSRNDSTANSKSQAKIEAEFPRYIMPHCNIAGSGSGHHRAPAETGHQMGT